MKTKNHYYPLLLILLIMSISACDWMNNEKEETDPSKTLGKVGNYWKGYANGYSDATITIEENNDGNVVATFP